MFFFDHILNPPKPGRHTEVGVIARLERELAELRSSRDEEVRGYKDALQKAGRDVVEARRNSDRHLHLFRQADAEVKRLLRVLGQDAQLPAAQAPAPADTPGSCFSEPDPAPVTTGPRAVADTPEGPVDSEAADVNAETQPVAQVDLDATQLLPKVVVDEAIGLGDTTQIPAMPTVPPVVPVVAVEPVPRVTWGTSLKPKQHETVPDWALGTAPPPGAGATEMSSVSGDRAVRSVAVSLGSQS